MRGGIHNLSSIIKDDDDSFITNNSSNSITTSALTSQNICNSSSFNPFLLREASNPNIASICSGSTVLSVSSLKEKNFETRLQGTQKPPFFSNDQLRSYNIHIHNNKNATEPLLPFREQQEQQQQQLKYHSSQTQSLLQVLNFFSANNPNYNNIVRPSSFFNEQQDTLAEAYLSKLLLTNHNHNGIPKCFFPSKQEYNGRDNNRVSAACFTPPPPYVNNYNNNNPMDEILSSNFFNKEKMLSIEEQQQQHEQQHYKKENGNSSSHLSYTIPGQITTLSPACCNLMPSISIDALAPLHIILPINLPFGKIVVAENSFASINSYTKKPSSSMSHHYYFKKQFPSARHLFCRLHGFCNQSPAWLALDVGYVACREHQVATVVDAFLHFFRSQFTTLILERRKKKYLSICKQQQNTTINQNNGVENDNDDDQEMSHEEYMKRIRLRCSGLRLRNDQGCAGWFLYETPVETCTHSDEINLQILIKMIEAFNNHLRILRLCQYTTMKPIHDNKFAIVVLKQEGIPVSPEQINQINRFQCEGIDISEVRLVRHKLLDIYGNSMFEKDPRFINEEIYGRPIACNKAKQHGRFVFAKAPLPFVVKLPAHQVHPIIEELEQESVTSENSDIFKDTEDANVYDAPYPFDFDNTRIGFT